MKIFICLVLISCASLLLAPPSLGRQQERLVSKIGQAEKRQVQNADEISASSIAAIPINLPHASSRADLAAMPSSLERVQRDGYAARGDAPAMLYIASDLTCSLNSGAGDGGLQISTSDGKCWVATFSPGDIPAVQYGVKCDGKTDNLPIINAIIHTANAIYGNATIKIPGGVCRISNTIVISSGTIRFSGTGQSNTNLQITSSNHIFEFAGSAFDCSVEDMRITSSVFGPTAGYAVYQTDGTGTIRLRNLRIEGTYGGVMASNRLVAGVISVNDVQFANLAPAGDTFTINGLSQLFVSDSSSYAKNAACFRLNAAYGVYVVNSTCQMSGYAVRVAPTTGNNVYDVFMSNFEADDSQGTDAAFSFDSVRGGKIWGVHLNAIRAGFGAGDGFRFDGANTSDVSLTNWTSERNLKNGVYIANLRDSVISDGQAIGNGAVSPGFDGVHIAQASSVVISGLRSSSYFPGAGRSNQGYGLSIDSTMTGILTVTASDLTGNRSGALLNASASTGLSIANVSGVNPRGAVSLTPSANPWTYAAGLSSEMLYINGGIVSGVSVGGVILCTASPCTVHLAPHQTATVEYSIVPNAAVNQE